MQTEKVKLNFGCGSDYREGWINVDMSQEGDEYGAKIKTDKAFNFDKFPYPFKDNTFDYIYTNQVLEHLLYPEKCMKELIRICKKGAIIEIRVPHFADYQAFENPTHKKYFSLNSINHMLYGSKVVRKELELTQQWWLRWFAKLVTASPYVWERFLRGIFPVVRGCKWIIIVKK